MSLDGVSAAREYDPGPLGVVLVHNNDVCAHERMFASLAEWVALIVAAFTGLRLGEMLALRWADHDFAKRLVHVRCSWVQGNDDTPKSGKVRSVPLIDQAARGLDALSRREHFTGDSDRLFVNDTATGSAKTFCGAATARRCCEPGCRTCGCMTSDTATGRSRCRCGR